LLFLMHSSLLFWIQSSAHLGIKTWKWQWEDCVVILCSIGRFHKWLGNEDMEL
jgi:hypothetical protein